MREIMRFNQNWNFRKGENKSQADAWMDVTLPHTWNALDGQDGGNDYFRGEGVYVKKFSKDDLPRCERHFLEIKGANSVSTVYLNGRKLGVHEGGYSTFRMELTDDLRDKNVLEIRVDNSPNRSVYPNNADFTFYGGLYRDVSIIGTSDAHFALEHAGEGGIRVNAIPDEAYENATVLVETDVVCPQEAGEVLVEILSAGGERVASRHLRPEEKENAAEAGWRDKQVEVKTENGVSRIRLKAELAIHGVHLWNGRKNPYLYTARATLVGKETALVQETVCREVSEQKRQRTLDQVETRFGVRKFYMDSQKGFFLNGKSYPLHGVSRHQDRKGIGNALLPEHHREDMDIICEMGANSIRLAHYQHDQYFLDLCDERGMVVWAEIPFISEYLEEGVENTLSQMEELITQNINHPSIVAWGLSNEVTMTSPEEGPLVENHRKLKALAAGLDSTRPTTMAVIGNCDLEHPYLQVPDLVSFNLYLGWYSGQAEDNGPWLDQVHEKYPGMPVGLSEYGCEAAGWGGRDGFGTVKGDADCEMRGWHSDKPQAGDYSEEYQAIYHEKLIRQLFSRPYLWSTYVWTMFDFGSDAKDEGGEAGQNHKGLVTMDRKYKKDAFYAYKAWLSDEPFVHICGKGYVEHVEETVHVTVYSNQPEVELLVNGKSLEKKRAEDHFFYFEVPNAGESRLQAVAGGCVDERMLKKVDTPNEKYMLKERGAVLNWFEITDVPGHFSVKDTIGSINANEKAKNVFAAFQQKLLGSLAGPENYGDVPKKEAADAGAGHGDVSRLLSGMKVTRLVNVVRGRSKDPDIVTKEELLELNRQLNQIEK